MQDRFTPPIAQTVPLREIIANEMRRAIIVGEIAPGTRLDEQWLADKFGVSRIPVREAFPLLARSGLVRLEPRRGAFVVGITNDDIHDIYEFRRVIEAYAIRRVAETIDAEGLAQLRMLAERVEGAMRANQPEQLAENDLEFHRQLVTMARSKRLLSAWEMNAELIAVFLSVNASTFRDISLSYDPIAEQRHTQLISLIEQHQVDAAEKIMKDHLHGSELVIRESIQLMHKRLETAQIVE
jgi:GntR family transcriptional regulator of gluconate operon